MLKMEKRRATRQILVYLLLAIQIKCTITQAVCYQGWSYKEKRCYKVYTEKKHWEEARQHCRQFDNGDLAYFHGVEEQHHIEIDIISDADNAYWIGLKGNGSHWKWTNNEEITYQSFKDDGTSTGAPTQDICVGIRGSLWYKYSCTNTVGFICQSDTVSCDVDDSWIVTHTNHCIKFMESKNMSWNSSRDLCRTNKGELATFESEAEAEFFLSNISIPTNHWIGMIFTSPDKHTWLNEGKEKSNGKRMGRILNSGCGSVRSTDMDNPQLQWFSETCDTLNPFICQLATCMTLIGSFACGGNTSECVSKDVLCDGKQNCFDNSDESNLNCAVTTNSPAITLGSNTLSTNYWTGGLSHNTENMRIDKVTTQDYGYKIKFSTGMKTGTSEDSTTLPDLMTTYSDSTDVPVTSMTVEIKSDDKTTKMTKKYIQCRSESKEEERRQCLKQIVNKMDFVNMISNNLLSDEITHGEVQLGMYFDLFDVSLDSRQSYMSRNDTTDWVEVFENFENYVKREGDKLSFENFHHSGRNIDSVIMNNNRSIISGFSVMLSDKTAHVTIHKICLENNKIEDYPITLSLIIMNTSNIFESYKNRAIEMNVDDTFTMNGSKTTYVISPIMSLSAYSANMEVSLQHIFTLRHTIQISAIIENKTWDHVDIFCGFILKSERLWSTDGCVVKRTDNISTTCYCNHTTNFAILMQVTAFELGNVHEMALNIITYLGCSVSLLTQLMTITVFTCVGTLNSERIYVHRNLCFAIVAAQIAFLAGIKAVHNKILCSIVALILHYFYTAVMVWMLVEGLHLYSKVVQVFGTEKSRVIYYCGFGWGVPLVLVTISATADWDGYGTPKSCWLSTRDGTIWAFVGPAIAIIVVNMVILWMVIRVIMKLEKNSEYDQIRSGIKGALFLLPLLGLTWMFGLMAVNEDLIVFQYLFAVFNSLQGFFIFLFHCVCNTEVRQALHRMREKRMLQRGEIVSSFSASTSTRLSLKDQSNKHIVSDKIKYKKNKITVMSQQVTTSSQINSTGSSRCSKGDVVLHDLSADEDDFPLMYI